jgi:hypothetical protein
MTVGPFECGYEPSGSIKCGEFLDYRLDDQEGLLHEISK